MGQHAWVLEVRPGYEEEYKKRHDEIWPEMVDALKKAGIRNYSIFRHGLTLFGYFETEDLEKTVAALAKDPVNARWSQSMVPLMKIEVDQRTSPSSCLSSGTWTDRGPSRSVEMLLKMEPAAARPTRGQCGNCERLGMRRKTLESLKTGPEMARLAAQRISGPDVKLH